MSARFLRVFLLALLAAGVLLGTASAQKGGGGTATKDIPLIATFYGFDSSGNALKITNDVINGAYVHQGNKPGQNKIVFSAGSLIFSIYKESGRWVNLSFDQVLEAPVPILDLKSEYNCRPPYFIYPEIWSSITTTYFFIRTLNEYQRVIHGENPLDPWAEFTSLVRTYPDFLKMSEGQVKYVCGVGNTVPFRTDDPNTGLDESQDQFALFQEPQFYEIQATDWNGDGVTDWVIRPYAGHFKVWDTDNKEYKDFPQGCIPRRVTSSAFRDCNHGEFAMPFELRLRRK